MIRLNDTDYDAAAIREHRQLIVELRDQALKDSDFELTVTLSITVGLLHELARREEGNSAQIDVIKVVSSEELTEVIATIQIIRDQLAILEARLPRPKYELDE